MPAGRNEDGCVQSPVPGGREHRQRAGAPVRYVHRSIGRHRHSVGISPGGEPLHHRSRRDVDHGERVGEVFRDVQRASVSREGQTRGIARAVGRRSVGAPLARGEDDRVGELHAVARPAVAIHHVGVPPRRVERGPESREGETDERRRLLDRLAHLTRPVDDLQAMLAPSAEQQYEAAARGRRNHAEGHLPHGARDAGRVENSAGGQAARTIAGRIIGALRRRMTSEEQENWNNRDSVHRR